MKSITTTDMILSDLNAIYIIMFLFMFPQVYVQPFVYFHVSYNINGYV